MLFRSIGDSAGYKNTMGGFNTFIGDRSGYNNQTGLYNICIGYGAGYNSVSTGNTFLGPYSGYNTTGGYNTNLGYLAGQGNDGSGNIFIGLEQYITIGVISSTFNNKYGVYKSIPNGITSNTSAGCKILVGGDFVTGTVGIGTLEPDSFTAGSMGSYTSTKLVVVGKILANSYTSFTGSHKIN
mgnify:CR=1 FL=1